jgi:hypothetical protein
MRRFIIPVLLLLASCATRPPINVINPQADYYGDGWVCRQEAARYAQHVRSSQQVPSSAQTQTNCFVNGRYVNCTSTSYPAPDLAQAFQSGYDAGAEDRAFDACMRARGWR